MQILVSLSRDVDEANKAALLVYNSLILEKDKFASLFSRVIGPGVFIFPSPTSFTKVGLKDYKAIARYLQIAFDTGGKQLASVRLNAYSDDANHIHFTISEGMVPVFDPAEKARTTPATKTISPAITYKLSDEVSKRFHLTARYSFADLRNMAAEHK